MAIADGKQASSRSKRKDSPLADLNPTSKQQTLSQLFSSAEKQRSGNHLSESPSGGKRRRLSPIANDKTSELEHSLPTRPASIENMYSFNSAAAAVDPSTSPSSPRARRPSSNLRPNVFAPQNGTRKLLVKNLRTTTKTDPDRFCSKTNVELDEALTAIFAGQRPELSNEELYRGAENICKLGRAEGLAKNLSERCYTQVLEGIKKPLLAEADKSNVEVLRAVLSAWATWKKQTLLIRGIFFYLDRAYLMQTSQPAIYDSGIISFRTHIFNDEALQTKIIDGACDLLLAERLGESPDTSLFQDAVNMMHDISVYTVHFEPRMLTLSQDFIAQWAQRESTANDLPEYVQRCFELIDVEVARCDTFALDSTTRRALLTLLEFHLIEKREDFLTGHDAVSDLLDLNDVENIAQLFVLMQRRRLGEKLLKPWTSWIDLTGTAIIFDEKQQDQMVVRLLELRQKLDNIWRTSFQKNEVLGHSLREAFSVFMNKSKKSDATWGTDNSKPGEMIAKYVDMLLRSGAKVIPTNLKSGTALKLSRTISKEQQVDEDDNEEDAVDEDQEVNVQLDQVLDLFRFVQGKAVFEAFYKKDLARRLLMGRSASSDAERSMLARLKSECGAGFTQNLEQMFKDIELAREEVNAYKSRLEQNDRKPVIDLNVNILSAAAWPTYPDVPVTIPLEIQKVIDGFEQHYYQKHSGRKLQWKHALAHCQLKASFPRGSKELIVSSFQAIVLLLFNGLGKDEELTYEHIKAASGLSNVEVQRTLQSLACAKLRPLTKNPKGRDVAPTDKFSFNNSFGDIKYRLKINAIQLKETKEENKETHERVAADRQYETQAAIVRIMKSRKTIKHSELIAEVITATKSRGVLGVPDIKRNIDRLIEKEYMERNEGNTYSYLA